MIVTVRTWYSGRSTRERRLLLLMTAIALPLLAWLLVVRPLDQAYEAALQEQLEAVDRNGRARALAQLIEEQPQAPANSDPGPDLVLVVAESAAQAGIALDRNEARGADGVEINSAAASLRSVLPWLDGLEARGLAVEELRIAPAGTGSVSLVARLERGAR